MQPLSELNTIKKHVSMISNCHNHRTANDNPKKRNNSIHHECDSRIENSVLMIAVWHNEACLVMINGDLEGRIILSYPHINDGFFFLLNAVFLYFKK